jgi:Zn-finger protein
MHKQTYQSEPNQNESSWLSSKDTKKALHINDCELMHKRERGELIFKKKRNAYFYVLPVK